MAVSFRAMIWPADRTAVAEFLAASEWPFHAMPTMSVASAEAVEVSGPDIATFWILDGGDRVGLVRLMDLADIPAGSPVFDLRIASTHRGRGIGRLAVAWLTGHLFEEHCDLHRIEATTRDDNTAMQTVLRHCGYRLEGRFIEAWLNVDGSRSDTLSFALLRSEHAADDTPTASPPGSA